MLGLACHFQMELLNIWDAEGIAQGLSARPSSSEAVGPVPSIAKLNKNKTQTITLAASPWSSFFTGTSCACPCGQWCAASE